MDFAVIKTGGKQYIVTSGTKVQIEKLAGNAGDEISFAEVLLRVQGDNVEIGTPTLSSPVKAKILSTKKGEKKLIFRYHSKTRYRKRKGHRQIQTEVEIM